MFQCILHLEGSCDFSVLCLLDLWVEDEATYVCEAQNHFGKIQAKAKVTVTGLGTTCKKMFSHNCSICFMFMLIHLSAGHLKEEANVGY